MSNLWIGRYAKVNNPHDARHDNVGLIVTDPNNGFVCVRWPDDSHSMHHAGTIVLVPPPDSRDLKRAFAVEQGDESAAPEGWRYGLIDEDGTLGWRKTLADGSVVYACGRRRALDDAGRGAGWESGYWQRWNLTGGGEMDTAVGGRCEASWCDLDAMLDADACGAVA